MTVLRFPEDGREVTFSALTISRGLEAAFGQAMFSTFDNLSARADDEIEIVESGTVRFRGFLEITEGNDVEGFDCSARSRSVQLDRFDATGREHFRRTTTASIVNVLVNTAGAEAGALASRPVNKFRLQRGESYRSGIQRMAVAHESVLTDDGEGQVRLFALPDQLSPTATWTDGQGTVTDAIRRRLDFSDWRREWLCRGNRLLVAADAATAGDDQISIGTIAATTRPSRRVLTNQAATSRADAASLIDWSAKRALAGVVNVTVTHSQWPAEPGDVVRVRSGRLGLDEVMVVASIEANLVARTYTAHCTLPDVYRARVKLDRSRLQRVRTWDPAA